jgi:hypothetical protein
MTATQSAVIVFDGAAWRVPVEGTVPQQWDHVSGVRGQEVDLPVAEHARLLKLGAIAAVEDAAEAIEALDRETGPAPLGEEGDDQLRSLSAVELIAYVTQNPGEAQRVFDLEKAGKRRATVVQATGFDLETGQRTSPI